MKHSHESHSHHSHSAVHHGLESGSNNWNLAFSATLHCLLGCGIGEVAGMTIGAALGWDNLNQMILGIVLGFVGGFSLGMMPLLKAQFSFKRAFKQVLVAEGLSILVMETAEALTQVYMPGVMHAKLTDAIFWTGMIVWLIAGFIAAFPINYIMIRKGYRHQH
jgi:hypothetical protein